MVKHLLFALFTMLSAIVCAQSTERQVVATAGGTYLDNINNFEMDYTIGEPAITTISNASVILTQGFQQPFFLMTSVPETVENSSGLNIYPNPVVDQLHIVIEKPAAGAYNLMLYDMLGQMLQDKIVTAGKNTPLNTGINLNQYATGNYFVRIMHENKEVKTLKIIKINQ